MNDYKLLCDEPQAWILNEGLTADRLDASYYEPRFLIDARELTGTGIATGMIGSLACKANCGATPKSVEYGEIGMLLLRGANVRPNRFAPSDSSCVAGLELESTNNRAIVPGDLLYTMSGANVGNSAVYPAGEQTASFSNTVARARFESGDSVDPYFAAVFLNSRLGMSQTNRLISGGVLPHVMPNSFKKLRLLLPKNEIQVAIGNLIRKADLCDQISERRLSEARHSLALELRLPDDINAKEEMFSWPNVADLNDRIDSWFFKRCFLKVERIIKELEKDGIESVVLKSAATVGYGYMPTEDYWDEQRGHPFFRTTNFSEDLRQDLSSVKYVNPNAARVPKHTISKGDILVIQCGNNTGRVTLVNANCEGWVFPSFALRVKPIGDFFDSGYLALFLDSPFGQLQIQRTISVTSVRPNTTKPAIESILIPTLNDETQTRIGDLTREATSLATEAVTLRNDAAHKTELLVTNKLDEEILLVEDEQVQKWLKNKLG